MISPFFTSCPLGDIKKTGCTPTFGRSLKERAVKKFETAEGWGDA
jgi:hypothetical protein